MLPLSSKPFEIITINRLIIYEHCKPLTMYMMDVKRAARFRGRGGREMATPVRRVPGRVGLVLTRKVVNKRSLVVIVKGADG